MCVFVVEDEDVDEESSSGMIGLPPNHMRDLWDEFFQSKILLDPHVTDRAYCT